MIVVQKGTFSNLTAAQLATTGEVLQVTSTGVVIGYWLPPSIWLAKAGRDPELVLLESILQALDTGVMPSPELRALWRERAGLGDE